MILAFFASNLRVEAQAEGRAGRQGQPGSCQSIIHKQDDYVIKLKSKSVQSAEIFEKKAFASHSYNHLFNILRSQEVSELSDSRKKASKTADILYEIFSNFSVANLQFRRALINIQYDEIKAVCRSFLPIALSYDFELIRHDYFISLYTQAHTLLEHQKTGEVNWTNFIDHAKDIFKIYITYLWGKFYDKLDRNSDKLSPDGMKAKYNKFFKKDLQDIFNNPHESFKDFILEILYGAVKLYNMETILFNDMNFVDNDWEQDINSATALNTVNRQTHVANIVNNDPAELAMTYVKASYNRVEDRILNL